MTVFRFTNYRSVIRNFIELNQECRGYQGKLADAAGCQRSYFSLVLSEKTELSMESAMRLALYWNLPQSETDYFLDLVSHARASFDPLKKRLEERLVAKRTEAENLSQRLRKNKTIDPVIENYYYSTWVTSAIHVLTGIDEYQSVSKISERLKLPPSEVVEHLEVLHHAGLVKKMGNKWQMEPGHFHLPKKSVLCAFNHFNWRNRAVQSSASPRSNGIHYTSLQSHSKEDLIKIKQLVLELIERNRTTIEHSPNEELSCLCIDFFAV
jgi:uncharacterized protein (TIGR02147 family)